MRKIHDVVGNWGFAIILLTLFVKAVLFPLTARQMQSMARMKELKPELDRINELYGDDREKKGAAIMELYRKRGVNPMSGCFPVLVQLPIWFSLYASLSSNVELFRAPFVLWWSDLSAPDPLFFLPLGARRPDVRTAEDVAGDRHGSGSAEDDAVHDARDDHELHAVLAGRPVSVHADQLCAKYWAATPDRSATALHVAASAGSGSTPPLHNFPLRSRTSSPQTNPHHLNEPHRAGRPSKAERRWRRGKR